VLTEFNKSYEIIEANTDKLILECFRLRHKSYYKESGINTENSNRFSLEFDKDDMRSVHYLILHRGRHEYAATIRVILPDEENPDKQFPLEQFLQVDHEKHPDLKNRLTMAEASRVCVLDEYKNTATNCLSKYPWLLLLALLACSVKTAQQCGKKYLLVASNKVMFRFCNSMGMNFVPVSNPVRFTSGLPRFANLVDIDSALASMALKNPEVSDYFNAIIKQTPYHDAYQ